MPRDIFLDAGAWIAINDAGDQYHAAASEFYRQISRERRPLVTTNLVLAEFYRLILYGASYHSAIRFLDAVDRSVDAGWLRSVYSSPDLEADARQILRQYDDQKLSYTDAVSFVVMRRLDISVAFTFCSLAWYNSPDKRRLIKYADRPKGC